MSQTKQSFIERSDAIYNTLDMHTDELLSQDFSFEETIQILAFLSKLHVTIADSDGEIYVATDGEIFYDTSGYTIPAEFYERIDRDGYFDDEYHLVGLLPDMKFVTARYFYVPESPIPEGIVIVSSDNDYSSIMLEPTHLLLVFLSSLVFAISLTLFLLATSRKAEPMHQFTDAIIRFSRGDLQTRITGYEGRTDELGVFVHAFNAAISSLVNLEAQRSEFISNISHELRTPMTSISGFADALLEGELSPEQQESALRIITNETARLSRLVSQMLNLTRLESEEQDPPPPVDFDLTELLSQVIISMEHKVRSRDLDVVVNMPNRSIWARGNPDGITQVCVNLLDNSSKFAAEGSTIQISLRRTDKHLLVSFRNLGKTIPSDELPYLFDRFHKEDQSRSHHPEGLGLGLYIVKAILNNANESITATSVDGVTTFTFTLTVGEALPNKPLQS